MTTLQPNDVRLKTQPKWAVRQNSELEDYSPRVAHWRSRWLNRKPQHFVAYVEQRIASHEGLVEERSPRFVAEVNTGQVWPTNGRPRIETLEFEDLARALDAGMRMVRAALDAHRILGVQLTDEQQHELEQFAREVSEHTEG